MNYLDHKTHFSTAYNTGADHWSHAPTDKEGSKLIENLKPGASVLEIGSGRGYFAKHLATLGFKTIGIDFETGIVSKANENIKDWGLEGKLKFVEADALAIPFTDGSFDAVCDFGLLETLFKEDWPKYATEVNRVLKPGGFYLNVSLSRETQSFYEFKPKGDATGDFEKYGIHYHFFEKEELKNIFTQKFAVISQETAHAEKGEKVVLLETLFKK